MPGVPQAANELVVFQRAYDLAVWYAERVTTFPKGFRHSLSDRIHGTLFDLVEALQDAAYAKERAGALRRAQDLVDRLRLWNRLATDLRCLKG